MLRRNFLSAAFGTAPQDQRNTARAAVDAVDMLLVLALDASGSLSEERLMLQREGHARAVVSDAFLDAVAAGACRKVGIAAFEWSSQDRQHLIVPWLVVEDAAGGQRVARTLRSAPRPMPGFTSISGGIDFSIRLLEQAPYAAMRRVIDISGNGPNNDGRAVTEARDDAVAAGITVNGLPILDAVADLDEYYVLNVIGGSRAFMIVARDIESFGQAILRKLALEVAAAPGPASGGVHDPVWRAGG